MMMILDVTAISVERFRVASHARRILEEDICTLDDSKGPAVDLIVQSGILVSRAIVHGGIERG